MTNFLCGAVLAFLVVAYVIATLILLFLADCARELNRWQSWLTCLFWPVAIVVDIINLIRENHR